MKTYEFIEHTADIGIRVKGDDLKGLFQNVADAMFDIIAEKKSKVKKPLSSVRHEKPITKKISIKLEADNLEELFINWLNELLSLSAAKGLIFSEFRIDKLDRNTLQARAIGLDTGNYKVNTEIKAATYHQLRIEQAKSGWQAELIFDV